MEPNALSDDQQSSSAGAIQIKAAGFRIPIPIATRTKKTIPEVKEEAVPALRRWHMKTTIRPARITANHGSRTRGKRKKN
jgi:hypothetical protein